MRAHFEPKYEVWTKEKDSLQQLGIANAAQLQQQNQQMQAAMQQQNAKIALLEESFTTTVANATEALKKSNDTTTTVSTLTTAESLTISKLQKELAEMKKAMATNGGNQQRQQRQKKPYQAMSDGPVGSVKTEKHYKDSTTCCFTHGYDVAPGHTSANCRFPGANHGEAQKLHTGDNPVPGASQKDKQFSQYADQPLP